MKWKKLVSESENGDLIIPTGLKGEKARDILDAIIGQMSDGMSYIIPLTLLTFIFN